MLGKLIARQFKKPTGLFGIFSSNIMIKGNMIKYEKIIKNLGLHPNDKVLEIGYGPGIGINMIARKCDSCVIHGIDFSELMYKRASSYNKQYIGDKVQLQFGDFLQMPIDSALYDKIFCLNVVYFWNNLMEPFQKVISLLKPGGTFHIYMATKEMLKRATPGVFNKYSVEEIVESLRLAGFAEVENILDKGYYIKSTKF
jgi:cyclopropane fatty-acyl-phospholipid synthase-like methyltransferase